MMAQTIFQALVVCTGALATGSLAVLYFSRVRLERPAIGTFNSRDLVILFGFIVVLPGFYLLLPSAVLTGFLVLTFTSAMSIALRPILAARYRRTLIPAVIVANIVVTQSMLGTGGGLVAYWLLTDTAVLLAAVGVSNLYVQGGLTLCLAAYDAFFSLVVPLTPMLAETFEGRPLNASIGFAFHGYNANIGLGDLLIYGLFATAALKGFGRHGASVALATIGVFGALLPTLAPMVSSHFNVGGAGFVVPAQVFFGPAALIAYLSLARRARRATAEPMPDVLQVRPALLGWES